MDWLWYLSLLWVVVTFILQLAWLPFSFLLRILLVLFSPVINVALLIGSILAAIGLFVGSLEPLWIFLSHAAFIGICAGIVMACMSITIQRWCSILEVDGETSRPSTADSQLLIKKDESSSYETDWQMLTPSKKKTRSSGLLSQVIHEEDSDSV